MTQSLLNIDRIQRRAMPLPIGRCFGGHPACLIRLSDLRMPSRCVSLSLAGRKDGVMTDTSGKTRTDSASRTIKAPRSTLYEAFLDSDALMSWLPPQGMRGHLDGFDPREGGTYRMSLTYRDADHSAPGKRPNTPTLSKRYSSSWSLTSGSCGGSDSSRRTRPSRTQ